MEAFEFTAVPDAPSPPMHLHRTAEELFYVVSGRMEFTVDGRVVAAQAGDALLVPRNTPHMFRYVGEEPVRMIAQLMPAIGLDDYFSKLAAIVRESSPPDRVKMTALAAQYDQPAA